MASLFVVRWRPNYDIIRTGSIVARITAALATMTTTGVFITDVVTVVLTREKLNSDGQGLLKVGFGNAVRGRPEVAGCQALVMYQTQLINLICRSG